MGLTMKVYKPSKEVCIQCGGYFPKDQMVIKNDKILGKIMYCIPCSKK